MRADYVVHGGRDADLDECVNLAFLAPPERSPTEWRAALSADLANDEHHLVVAESGGEIVGYGRVRLWEPEREPEAPAGTAPSGYYLSGVFVRADLRRRGVAAALTQARLEWIGERADEAWFFANARNAASIELHGRFGFEEFTRRFSFPGVTFEGGEGILFRLSLPRPN